MAMLSMEKKRYRVSSEIILVPETEPRVVPRVRLFPSHSIRGLLLETGPHVAPCVRLFFRAQVEGWKGGLELFSSYDLTLHPETV
jgi:hypothetical protein